MDFRDSLNKSLQNKITFKNGRKKKVVTIVLNATETLWDDLDGDGRDKHTPRQ